LKLREFLKKQEENMSRVVEEIIMNKVNENEKVNQ
jgi:hypothetical protein